MTLPAARCAAISARWSLSRNGSAATASRAASTASPNRRRSHGRALSASNPARVCLTHPFPLDERPVVVPAGEQVQPVEPVELDGEVGPGCRPGREPGYPLAEDGDVDRDARAQPQRRGLDGQHVWRARAQSPQGGAQVARGARFVDVGPQRFGDDAALDQSAVEGDEGQEFPRPLRDGPAFPVDRQPDAVEQSQDDRRTGAVTPMSDLHAGPLVSRWWIVGSVHIRGVYGPG